MAGNYTHWDFYSTFAFEIVHISTKNPFLNVQDHSRLGARSDIHEQSTNAHEMSNLAQKFISALFTGYLKYPVAELYEYWRFPMAHKFSLRALVSWLNKYGLSDKQADDERMGMF